MHHFNTVQSYSLVANSNSSTVNSNDERDNASNTSNTPHTPHTPHLETSGNSSSSGGSAVSTVPVAVLADGKHLVHSPGETQVDFVPCGHYSTANINQANETFTVTGATGLSAVSPTIASGPSSSNETVTTTSAGAGGAVEYRRPLTVIF